MKVWIEAFYPDGSQILGNGDGQGPIVASQYRRTLHYKNVRAGKVSKRPAFYRVVADNGKVLEEFQPGG